MKEVAIILPVFRGRHLHRVLSSLSRQKDKSFRLYVSDDASPDDIAAETAEFEDALDIEYHRFEDHCGIARRGAHLERSLSLIKDEKLVCFFSDQNELTPDAVQRIVRAARRNEEVKVFHLDTDFIDDASVVTGSGKRYCRRMSAERLFKRIFVRKAPAPLSSFFFRREALDKAMFAIKDVARAPLALVFSAVGTQGRLLTVRRARLLKRSDAAVPDYEKSRQMLSFFNWSEYFFEEGRYPLSPVARVELFASHAAGMYPTRTEEEIREEFLRMRVFEREMGKGRGKRILHRNLIR